MNLTKSFPRSLRVSFSSLCTSACFLLGAASAGAGLMTDGAYFQSDFSGTSLSAPWSATVDVGGSITVGDGLVTINSLGADNVFMQTSGDPVNLGAATDYVAEVQFSIGSGGVLSTVNREMVLLWGTPSSLGATAGFYITLLEGSSASSFSLGWGGTYAPTGPYLLAAGATDLARETTYTLSMYCRTDGEIAFYLDGALLGERSSFGNALTLENFRVGDFAGTTEGIINIDYISVGAPVPEPAALILSGLGCVILLGRKKFFTKSA